MQVEVKLDDAQLRALAAARSNLLQRMSAIRHDRQRTFTAVSMALLQQCTVCPCCRLVSVLSLPSCILAPNTDWLSGCSPRLACVCGFWGLYACADVCVGKLSSTGAQLFCKAHACQ